MHVPYPCAVWERDGVGSLSSCEFLQQGIEVERTVQRSEPLIPSRFAGHLVPVRPRTPGPVCVELDPVVLRVVKVDCLAEGVVGVSFVSHARVADGEERGCEVLPLRNQDRVVVEPRRVGGRPRRPRVVLENQERFGLLPEAQFDDLEAVGARPPSLYVEPDVLLVEAENARLVPRTLRVGGPSCRALASLKGIPRCAFTDSMTPSPIRLIPDSTLQ